MMRPLLAKLLRDVRLPLLWIALLLCGFQILWARISLRISQEVLPSLTRFVPMEFLKKVVFDGPGEMIRTMLGGDAIDFAKMQDMLSIGYVHPLMQTVFCIWAVGRASGAIAGELDRGTMELLLAQPVPRSRLILAHLLVDVLTIPLLCLSLWAGNWLGAWIFGTLDLTASSATASARIDPRVFGPALWNVGALIFAVSGFTMWLSARGRFRLSVLGVAVLVLLLQFIINLVGQLWDAAAPLRPFTVFYWFQPQQIILAKRYTIELGQVWNGGQPLFAVNVLLVLFVGGIVGYLLALWTFCRRDLPAPL